MKNLVQIAGIKDVNEAMLLVNCGVDHLGFPLRISTQKEDISEKEAAKIIRSLVPPVHGVLITYLDNAKEIISLCRYLGASTVQLHGDISTKILSQLKVAAPHLRVIKSLIVRHNNLPTLKAALGRFSPWVDAFIIDTYDPATGACGATGKTHDWNISRLLVQTSPRPVFLAGGLTPNNVRRAILEVKPAGVDAHTGVEGADGRKNQNLVEEFIFEAREGFAAI